MTLVREVARGEPRRCYVFECQEQLPNAWRAEFSRRVVRLPIPQTPHWNFVDEKSKSNKVRTSPA